MVQWRKKSQNNFSTLARITPWKSMKKQKDMTPEDEFPRLERVRYATVEEWGAITNSSRKSEVAGSKWKWSSVMDVTADGCKAWCCKEQCCIGTWNVRSMNQGQLEVIKQEMERLNIDILGISELKWIEMGEFISDDYCVSYCVQESLRKIGVTLIVNKSLLCSSWVQSQK